MVLTITLGVINNKGVSLLILYKPNLKNIQPKMVGKNRSFVDWKSLQFCSFIWFEM